ncbi:hypothetical protein ACEQPO_06630 [Bacillus sp. SL00103]
MKSFYGGLAEPVKILFPPALEGYNDDIDPYPYDPEKAKLNFLKEAAFLTAFASNFGLCLYRVHICQMG